MQALCPHVRLNLFKISYYYRIHIYPLVHYAATHEGNNLSLNLLEHLLPMMVLTVKNFLIHPGQESQQSIQKM